MSSSKTPKLLILNQMAGPMTWELAEDLGHFYGNVALLTGHPDTLAKGSSEHISLYPAAPYQRGSFLRRAISWMVYTVQAFFWLWRFPASTPLLLFSNPPILSWLGWLMFLTRRQTFAVMVHDIYPDLLVSLAGFSANHILVRIWGALNRAAYRRAAVVMTLGEHMASNLERQLPPSYAQSRPVHVVYPWADMQKITPIPKAENWFARQYGQVDKLTLMYSGNMGLGHDLETMLQIAEQLSPYPEINFMFIGSGPKWNLVKDIVQEKQLTNVILLPWQPEEVLPYSLATADVALVSIEAGVEGLMIPSKAIYALAAGSQVLLLAEGKSDLRDWLSRYKLGLTANKAQQQTIIDWMLALKAFPAGFESQKQVIRCAADEIFSRRVGSPRIVQLLYTAFPLERSSA